MSSDNDRREAKDEIRETLLYYARGVDRLDVELVAAAFHDNAILRYGSLEIRGASTISSTIVDGARLSGAVSFSHAILNHLIQIDIDSGVAGSEARFVRWMAWPEEDGGRRRIGTRCGRYLDTFAFRGDKWRILERLVVVDWSRIDTAQSEDGDDHLVLLDPATDPSYSVLARSS